MRKVSGVVAMLLCLLLVGLVRTAVPPYTPSEYDVLPDDAGVGHHDNYTVELGGFWTADELVYVDTYGNSNYLVTDHVFVVMRARVTPYNKTLLSSTELITADGYTYASLASYPFPDLTVSYVGQRVTTHFLFEVPRDKLEGAFVTFSGPQADGIQPMWPRLRFDVVAAEAVDTFEVPANIVEPRR